MLHEHYIVVQHLPVSPLPGSIACRWEPPHNDAPGSGIKIALGYFSQERATC